MEIPKQLQSWLFKPKERAAAKASGQTTYFTGRPCKHGHVVLRITSSGCCVECFKIIQKQTIKNRLIRNPNWYKEKYAKNPEKYKKIAADYRKRNPEKVKESNARTREKSKPQKAALQMKRNADKICATPKWLTKEHKKHIKQIYIVAKETSDKAGFKCHVDHIVPLKGKTVCGLHVPWNLRVVSQSFNSIKKNKIDEESLNFPSSLHGVLIHQSALPWNWKKNEHNLECV